MTYPELLIALDIGDPEAVLSSLTNPYNPYEYEYGDKKIYRPYFVICDDGDCYCFDKNGKEHEIDYIPDNCFAHRFFDKIIIPKTVTSIGDSAFWCCSALTSVTILNSVTIIRDYAFSGCSGLTSVTIPDSMTSIGDCVFWGCHSLMKVTILNSVTSIGYGAFSSCASLESVVFKGKTMEQVKAMDNYPWGIIDESVINVEC